MEMFIIRNKVIKPTSVICAYVCAELIGHVRLLQPHGLWPTRVFRSWDGTFQARILEWVAISSSKGSSPAKDQTHVLHLLCCQADSLPLSHLGSHISYTSHSKGMVKVPFPSKGNTKILNTYIHHGLHLRSAFRVKEMFLLV